MSTIKFHQISTAWNSIQSALNHQDTLTMGAGSSQQHLSRYRQHPDLGIGDSGYVEPGETVKGGTGFLGSPLTIPLVYMRWAGFYLVIYLSLWKMMEWKSVGMITFPTEWNNKKYIPNHLPVYIYIYIYMVPPPVPPLCTFTGIYGVFLHIWGYIFLNVFSNKFGHSFKGEYHVYIYNRGCRQTCETWWFWHQEVLGGPRTSLEPRTKIAQKVLGESWSLVLGSKEVLGPLTVVLLPFRLCLKYNSY